MTDKAVGLATRRNHATARQRLDNGLLCKYEWRQYVDNVPCPGAVRYPGAVGGRLGIGTQIYDLATSEEDANKTGDSTRSAVRIKDRAGLNAQVLAMREKDAECSACGREDCWYEQLNGWWELSNDGVRFSPAAWADKTTSHNTWQNSTFT